MLVRFRKEYSDSEPRMAYELVEGYPTTMCYVACDQYQLNYNTKLLGLVPAYQMEETTDPNDIPAIDVFVNLSNK